MTTRRGWATTEFWTAVAVGVGSLAASIAGYLPPRYAAIASAVAIGAYNVARGLAKLGNVPTPTPAPLPAAPAPVAPAEPPPAIEAPPTGVT